MKMTRVGFVLTISASVLTLPTDLPGKIRVSQHWLLATVLSKHGELTRGKAEELKLEWYEQMKLDASEDVKLIKVEK